MVLVIIAALAFVSAIILFCIRFWKFKNGFLSALLYALTLLLAGLLIIFPVFIIGITAPDIEYINIPELEQIYEIDSSIILIDSVKQEAIIVSNSDSAFQTKIHYIYLCNSADGLIHIQELKQEYVKPNWIISFGSKNAPGINKHVIYLPNNVKILYIK